MKNACAMLQPSLQTRFNHTLGNGYLETPEERTTAATVAARSLPPRLDREVLGSIHAAHYPHVLKVCRRFFRQPEDAEDAAAEVFLKLHAVLEKKNQEDPFRPWVRQAGIALTNCADASAKNVGSSREMICAPSRTFPLLLPSPRFCTTKQKAK
jgi:Sigma-70 region 2